MGWRWLPSLVLVVVVFLAGYFFHAFDRFGLRPPKDWTEFKDWAQVAAALVTGIALLFTAATFRFAAAKNKRDLFVKLHESLIEPEVQDGRRILARTKRYADVVFMKSSDRKAVNRALSLYETLAIYVLNGNVYEKEALRVWDWPIWNMRQRIGWFVDAREEEDLYRSWPNLRRLIKRMEKKPPKKP